MHIALSPEQERLKTELRAYFDDLVTPEIRTALSASTGEFGDSAVYKDVIRRIGHDGWLGIAGADPVHIGEVALGAGVAIYGMEQERIELEQLFFQLTAQQWGLR